MDNLKPGSIGWCDLTVPDAVAVRDFYQAVVGWETSPVDMGGYEDFCMIPPGAPAPAAGICHARGPNVGIPAQWMVYLTVADLDASLAAVLARGGAIVCPTREMGPSRMAIIRDPAGAVCALFQP